MILIMTGDKANFAVLSSLIHPNMSRPRPRPSTSSYSTLSLAMVLSVFVLTVILQLLPAGAVCNQDDVNSLWSFYSGLSLPSADSLNWNNSSDCCSWDGVGCDATVGRVTRLWLPSRDLNGNLFPSIANLTGLSHLNLSHNRLSGSLPVGFFSALTSLQVLDLSYNRLYGELPSSAISPSNSSLPIQIVDLSSNRFRGPLIIPYLQAATNLTSFNVSNNSFTGPIPSNICRISSPSLTLLDFSNNDFDGNVPSGLGKCSRLEIFRAGFNNLSGTIPDDLYQALSLEVLSVPVNHLTGNIRNAIVNLSRLRILELFSNQLTGVIPQEIGRLSNLEALLLHINNLTGSLPSSLSNCTNLVTLNLRVNLLVGELSAFNFARFLRLSTLDLGNNNFTGVFPASLYSCISLTAVRFASNQLEGQISPNIMALQSLSFLSVSANNLTNITGAIRILMGCKKLTTLILSNNTVNEAIPDDGIALDSVGFQNLQVLAIGGCQLYGKVPSWLSILSDLQVLDLSYNRLTGSIPGWLGNLSSLFYLDLSKNSLTGEFPPELTGLQALQSSQAGQQLNGSYLELPVFVQPDNATNLQYNQLSSLPPAIYMRQNNLSGNIPAEIGQLKGLHILDLSINTFSGNVPDQLSQLTNLERLDLSENHFSGVIPASLKGLHFLSWFSVANNNLQGSIPSGGQFDTFPMSSFIGNAMLCGQILQRPCPDPSGTNLPTAHHKSRNPKLIIGLVLGICFGTGLFIALLVLWILSKRRIIPGGDSDNIELDTLSSNSYSGLHPQADKEINLVVLFPNNTENIKDLTMHELLKATDNFSQANIIGCGGFGLVYKATLEDGTKLAVKRLSGDLGLMEREFKAEVEALSTAQHENLVSLQGYCFYEGYRLLIYSYMENGSLDYWLHEKIDGANQLDWPTRLKISRGASCGLAYMHQICEPHIVHRDIKSSNILLDDRFEAHVADFGFSRLILPYHTHVTTELVGTLGYIPPEYGQAWVATLRGDVYSFGVVMLELLTGKRPVEVSKPKMSRELVAWVQLMRSDGKQEQVFDPILRGKGFDAEMLEVLDVACLCVNQNPFKRPTIQEVVDWLKDVGSDRNQNKG